ncbi:AAA family ATPase [bacterium]|nr:AAA family ATPase [bacterium]
MYLEYFGFKDKPFSITPDSKYLFLTKHFESALGTLEYSIKSRLGFMVLTGEVGTGKTTLARELLNRLGDNIETALLVNPLISVPELLQAINKDFGNNVRYKSLQKQIDALNSFLLTLVKEGKNAVVIIDESQNLSIEALEMIRMLSNLETEKDKLLQIMLVGQPELMRKLGTYEMRQLDQRVATKCFLKPFKFIEMMRYINHRIYIAGGGGKVFIEPKAYKILYKVTRGFPRLINIVCDRALMACYVNDTQTVDLKIMKQAINDWRGEDAPSIWNNIKCNILRKVGVGCH